MQLPQGSKELKFIAYLERLEAELTMDDEVLVDHGYATDLPGPSAPPPPPDMWDDFAGVFDSQIPTQRTPLRSQVHVVHRSGDRGQGRSPTPP